MSDDTAIAGAIPGLRAGGTQSRAARGRIARFAEAVTPSIRLDPRAALRDMRVTDDQLRTVLADPARCPGLTIEDGDADDPYADASGDLPKRRFSILKSASDQLVLLQIPDWVANDGGNVGAFEEMRDIFVGRKVRIVADKVLTPALSLAKTLPRIWREKAGIDVEFISWRYVVELLEGKQSAGQVFGFGVAPAAAAPPSVGPASSEKHVFIGSTSVDLKAYRDAAREVCLAMGFFPIMMENFEAMGRGATAGSLKKLDQANLYVGIFAHRYGFIEPGYTVSVTENEFDHAGERNLPRLCFVVDPTFPWPPDSWDPEHFEQMKKFKSRIELLIRGRFTTPDNFRSLLTQALAAHRP